MYNTSVNRPSLLARIVLLALLLVTLPGCKVDVSSQAPGTPTQGLITATLPPSNTPRPSMTPTQAVLTPTQGPASGTTNTQVNVRAEPSTDGKVLGILAAGASVVIVGRDAGGSWWQIVYEQAEEKHGWVAASLIVTKETPNVPVIGDGTTSGAGVSGSVTQQVNVRSGPGTTYNALGLLDTDTVVTLTGRNDVGTWVQIEYKDGPDGKGWISSAFVKTDAINALPIIGESGEVGGTPTPTTIPPTPTATLIPANFDSDSRENPLLNVTFAPTNTRLIDFTNDVSAPEGDEDDWIGFSAQASQPGTDVTLYASLKCTGGGILNVELWLGDKKVPDWNALTCATTSMIPVTVKAGQQYYLHFVSGTTEEGLYYTQYVLHIEIP